MAHIRSFVVGCFAGIALLLTPLVEVALDVGRSLEQLYAGPVFKALISGDNEMIHDAGRRLTLWDRVRSAGEALKDYARRALEHDRYTAGMFSYGNVGGPQHLAM